jgi:hypothetical protein
MNYFITRSRVRDIVSRPEFKKYLIITDRIKYIHFK